MRVLVIDDAVKNAAQKVIKFALDRRLSIHDLTRSIKSQNIAPGDDPNRRLMLFDGYKVVYTVEQHPSGWFHHISISIDARASDKPMPHPLGVEEILKLFGLEPIARAVHSWVEDFPGGKAVNLMFQFMEP